MLAALLLLAAVSRADLADEVLDIKANDWKFVEIAVRQHPLRLDCSYEALTAGKQVRMALLTQIDLERMRAEEPHGFLSVTEPHARGSLSFRIAQPGEYAVLILNDDDTPARVRLRVSEDFAAGREPAVRFLSRTRQLTVIVLSFVVFFGVVTWSARRLLGTLRR